MGAPNTTRAIGAARRALGLHRALEFAGVGATCGALGAVLVITILRAASEDSDGWGLWLLALAGAGGLAGSFAGWIFRPGSAGAARELDRRLGLHDLLSSALELGGSRSPEVTLLVARAERMAATVRPRAVVPLASALRTAWWVWLGPTLAIGVGVGLWLPTRVPAGRVLPAPAPPALAREAVDLVRDSAAAMEAKAGGQAAPGDHPASAWQREIKRELEMGGRSEVETRALAAQAAERAADALEESARQATDRADSLAERLANAAAASRALPGGAPGAGPSGGAAREVGGPGEALREAVRDGNLHEAASVIAEARKRQAEMSPQDREALARELEKWASELSSGGERAAPGARPPGQASRPGPDPQQPSVPESGGMPERDGAAEIGSARKPPVGDAAPGAQERVAQDPLAEQLRDAAREVRGESLPSASDGAAPQPREAERQGGASPNATQPPKQADDPRATPPEPSGEKQGEPRGASEQREGPRQAAEGEPTSRGDDPGARESQPGESKARQKQPGQSSPGQSQESQSQPGENQPATESPGERPSADATREAPTGPGATEAPDQAPGGEAPARQPGAGGQPSGGLEGLERTLRETGRLRDQAAEDAARARHLRERARHMLNPEADGSGGKESSGQPRDGQVQDRGAGDGSGGTPRPGLHEAPDPRGPSAFPSAADQLDLRPPSDTEGPMTPLAEWDRAPGDGLPAPVGPGVAGRLRAAAGSAERAIEDRRVPPQYADLVRRVFRRYVDRAPGGGTP